MHQELKERKMEKRIRMTEKKREIEENRIESKCSEYILPAEKSPNKGG